MHSFCIRYAIALVLILTQNYAFANCVEDVYLVSGDFVMSIAVAFVMNVCIESPLIILEEIVRPQRSTASINRASTTKHKKFAAVMEKYFYLINGQLGSDSAVEMKIQQMNFWQSMSSVLNCSSNERPTKTPAEWVKTWQKWKNDTLRENREKYIQTEADQSEIRVLTLEQEFLTFLAAASYGFSFPANFKESCIEVPARFRQLDSRDLLHEDLVQSSTSDFTPITKGRVHRKKL